MHLLLADTVGSSFFIPPAIPRLLISGFDPFTFRVIINVSGFSPAFLLFVFWSFVFLFFYTAYIHCTFKMQLKLIKFYSVLCSGSEIFV